MDLILLSRHNRAARQLNLPAMVIGTAVFLLMALAIGAEAVELRRRHGELAVFHGGPASELDAVRDEIRREYPEAPVLLEYSDKTNRARILRRARQRLNPRKLESQAAL